MDRCRQRDVVAEEDSADEQHGRERDERGDHALAVLLDRGREEPPDLPEDDRQGEQEAREQRHLHRGQERLGGAEGHRLRDPLGERPVQPVEDPSVDRIRRGEPDGQRSERDDDARSQLPEVLDERRLLAVAKTTRKQAHR